jgi:hypothetical protein
MANGKRSAHKFYSHPGCNTRRGHCQHPRFWNGFFRLREEDRTALIAIFQGNAMYVENMVDDRLAKLMEPLQYARCLTKKQNEELMYNKIK